MRTQLHITTDPNAVDVGLVHQFLSQQSTWARGIPFAVVERAVKNSLCFSGFVAHQQMAFARVISDYATFANLVDVFVLPAYRGHGYSKTLMEAVLGHPDLQGLRRFTLATSTAKGLYARFGFKPLAKPETFMERYYPEIYAEP